MSLISRLPSVGGGRRLAPASRALAAPSRDPFGQSAAVALIAILGCGAIATSVTLGGSFNSKLVAWGGAIALAVLTRVTLSGRTVVGVFMVYGYVVFGVAAALLYHPSATDYYGPTPGVAYLATATPGYRYLAFFDVIALATYSGFFMFSGRRAPSLSSGRARRSVLDAMPVITIPSSAIALAVVPLALDVYGTGFHTVLHSSIYLQHTGPLAASKIGRALGPVGLLAAGNAMFANPELRMRVAATGVALAYTALYLAVDTRYFGLVIPLVYLGGLLSGKWSARQRTIGLVVAAAAAILMIQVPLALRALPEHGLGPSITYITQDPGALLANPINNIFFGAPLTLYVGRHVSALPLHDLVTSLSPLPSSLTDYAAIQPTLRLSATVPYSALGELLNYGWMYVAGIVCAIGAIYALLERVVRRSIVPGLGVLILSSVAAVTVVESTEYNLRTVARIAYYAAVIVIMLMLVPNGFRRDRGLPIDRS